MVVGLTGGVGSGKDLAAAEFKRLGATVIDADAISREVLEPGEPAYCEAIKEFGDRIICPDGTIDRAALGAIVFHDASKLKRLNAITHPVIMREVEGRIEALTRELGPEAIIVLNAPLLIEVGHHTMMDKVVVITCDSNKQLERIMDRDRLTATEALARINSQMPLGKKEALADFVIDNNGTREETLKRVGEVYEELGGS